MALRRRVHEADDPDGEGATALRNALRHEPAPTRGRVFVFHVKARLDARVEGRIVRLQPTVAPPMLEP